VHIESLVFGNPFVELSKTTYIASSSGFISEIDYSGKGWMSGKKNSFTAKTYAAGKERDILYSASGQWNEAFQIREGGGGSKPKLGSGSGSKVVESYVSATAPTTPLTVAPLAEQDPLEAKRAWKKVVDGILKGDMDVVHVEKSKIEMAQRELRRQELAGGREYRRTFFSQVPNSAVFDALARVVPGGERIEADKTGGIWRFDEEKFRTATRPFGQGNLGQGDPAPANMVQGNMVQERLGQGSSSAQP